MISFGGFVRCCWWRSLGVLGWVRCWWKRRRLINCYAWLVVISGIVGGDARGRWCCCGLCDGNKYLLMFRFLILVGRQVFASIWSFVLSTTKVHSSYKHSIPRAQLTRVPANDKNSMCLSYSRFCTLSMGLYDKSRRLSFDRLYKPSMTVIWLLARLRSLIFDVLDNAVICAM